MRTRALSTRWSPAAPRRFGKGRQANANEGFVWPLLTGFGTPVGIVEQFQDTFQSLRIVAGVIRQASRRLVGKGVRRNEVTSAYLGGSNPRSWAIRSMVRSIQNAASGLPVPR